MKDIEKKTWEEFRETGLLWFINTTLHVFGWAIVVDVVDDKITSVYPARVKFRGFKEEVNDAGYQKITKYLKDNINNINNDMK